MNEVKDFHPMVEQWLTDNGYSFRHHVRLDYGIADYVATRDGKTIVVECKFNTYASNVRNGRFFAQVLDYARQVPNSKPFAALPSYLVTDKTRQICKHYGIGLIVINMVDTRPKKVWVKPIRSMDSIRFKVTEEQLLKIKEGCDLLSMEQSELIRTALSEFLGKHNVSFPNEPLKRGVKKKKK